MVENIARFCDNEAAERVRSTPVRPGPPAAYTEGGRAVHGNGTPTRFLLAIREAPLGGVR